MPCVRCGIHVSDHEPLCVDCEIIEPDTPMHKMECEICGVLTAEDPAICNNCWWYLESRDYSLTWYEEAYHD